MFLKGFMKFGFPPTLYSLGNSVIHSVSPSREIRLGWDSDPKRGGSTSLNPWAIHDIPSRLADLTQDLRPSGAVAGVQVR